MPSIVSGIATRHRPPSADLAPRTRCRWAGRAVCCQCRQCRHVRVSKASHTPIRIGPACLTFQLHISIMVVCAPIAGIVGNIVGMRRVLVFGTLGYAPYSLALYYNTVYGTQWLLLSGAVTCGFSVSWYPVPLEIPVLCWIIGLCIVDC